MGWLSNRKWETKKDVMKDIIGHDNSVIYSRGVKRGMVLIWRNKDEENRGVFYLIEKDSEGWSYKDISIWECETLNNKELKFLDNEYYREEIKKYKEEREKEKQEKEKLEYTLENLEENKFYKVYTKKGNCIKLQFIFKTKNKIYFDKGYLLVKDIKDVEVL